MLRACTKHPLLTEAILIAVFVNMQHAAEGKPYFSIFTICALSSLVFLYSMYRFILPGHKRQCIPLLSRMDKYI